MSDTGNRSITDLLSADRDYPAWLASTRVTHPAWYTCCHEAGHVIGGLILLNATSVTAVIFDSREGATMVPRSSGYERSIVIATGEAGARLAHRFRPPECHPAYYPCERAFEETVSQPTDSELLVEMAGVTAPRGPSRKKIRKHASQFVRQHALLILAVATHLFRHGSGEFSLTTRPTEQISKNIS